MHLAPGTILCKCLNKLDNEHYNNATWKYQGILLLVCMIVDTYGPLAVRFVAAAAMASTSRSTPLAPSSSMVSSSEPRVWTQGIHIHLGDWLSKTCRNVHCQQFLVPQNLGSAGTRHPGIEAHVGERPRRLGKLFFFVLSALFANSAASVSVMQRLRFFDLEARMMHGWPTLRSLPFTCYSMENVTVENIKDIENCWRWKKIACSWSDTYPPAMIIWVTDSA